MSYGYSPYGTQGKVALDKTIKDPSDPTGQSEITINYYDIENIQFISQKATNELLDEFMNPVLFSVEDIVRVMTRVMEEKIESIPEMNTRVIMYLTHDYRLHAYSAIKALRQGEGYIASQNPAYDGVADMVRFDQALVKKINNHPSSSNNSTMQFYFA